MSNLEEGDILNTCTQPEAIPSSWHWAGPWLMLDRIIEPYKFIPDAEVNCNDICPRCLSYRIYNIPLRQPYACMFYCIDCYLIYLPYPARCPVCDVFVSREDMPEGKVKCAGHKGCGTIWDVDNIKSANLRGDFDIGGDLD